MQSLRLDVQVTLGLSTRPDTLSQEVDSQRISMAASSYIAAFLADEA